MHPTTTTFQQLQGTLANEPEFNNRVSVNPVMKSRIRTYQARKTILIEEYFLRHPVRPANQLEMFHQLQKETNDILEAICAGNYKEVSREIEELAVKSACMDIVKAYINQPYPSF